MRSNAKTAPSYYNSLYRHGVDEKRRVQIPAKWRPARTGVELTLVVWPKAKEGTCLRVLPPEKMSQLLAELDAMPNSDPNKGFLKRYMGAKSEQVALDNSGRICLPEAMAREAGITIEVVLVGMLDRFEIWSPERYERISAAEAVMAQEAFKLME